MEVLALIISGLHTEVKQHIIIGVGGIIHDWRIEFILKIFCGWTGEGHEKRILTCTIENENEMYVYHLSSILVQG